MLYYSGKQGGVNYLCRRLQWIIKKSFSNYTAK